jgi:hypothetical protein
MATVFARLKVPDGKGGVTDHGVHAFIVPLRDEAGRTLIGVEIQDCGYKVGVGVRGWRGAGAGPAVHAAPRRWAAAGAPAGGLQLLGPGQLLACPPAYWPAHQPPRQPAQAEPAPAARDVAADGPRLAPCRSA